jgi:hypothetical protein
MGPAHAAHVVEVGIGLLRQLAALALQLLPAVAPNATPIGIHRVALIGQNSLPVQP